MLARTLTDLAPLFLFPPCQLFTAPATVCRLPSDLPHHGLFLLRSECLLICAPQHQRAFREIPLTPWEKRSG
jgi:hypothetical protein